MNIKAEIKKMIEESLGITDVEVNETPSESFGDYSTNLAFNYKKGKPPIEVAKEIIQSLRVDTSMIKKVGAAGPGFINFWLKEDYLKNCVLKIMDEGSQYGASNLGNGKQVLVEFVSANPTGPLNVANGRAAAIGDSLVRILNFTGYKADAEYYVDDSGTQIERLEKSIKARYDELDGKKVQFPEDGYRGDYIIDIARELKVTEGELKVTGSKDFREFGVQKIIDMQKAALKNFGVEFKKWIYESSIRKSGKPEEIIKILKAKGLAYEQAGALWIKTTAFGDEKDRVLVKSNGEYTYLLPDIGYHLDKFERGYDWLINLWGPDHHGYIPRIKAGISACGYPGDKLTVIIVQWVTLVRGAEKVGMSKRKGEFVTLEDLISEVGKDVARFFFLTRKAEAHLDFDIELAKRESAENPVYYVQYAHARISSILRYAREQNISMEERADVSLLGEPEELSLIRKLVRFPEIVETAARHLEPHRIPFYLLELATLFHNFYEKHRVVTDNIPLTMARLNLVLAVRQTLKNGLSLIGITAPERM